MAASTVLCYLPKISRRDLASREVRKWIWLVERSGGKSVESPHSLPLFTSEIRYDAEGRQTFRSGLTSSSAGSLNTVIFSNETLTHDDSGRLTAHRQQSVTQTNGTIAPGSFQRDTNILYDAAGRVVLTRTQSTDANAGSPVSTRTESFYGFGSTPELTFDLSGTSPTIAAFTAQVPGMTDVLAISGVAGFTGDPVWTLPDTGGVLVGRERDFCVC